MNSSGHWYNILRIWMRGMNYIWIISNGVMESGTSARLLCSFIASSSSFAITLSVRASRWISAELRWIPTRGFSSLPYPIPSHLHPISVHPPKQQQGGGGRRNYALNVSNPTNRPIICPNQQIHWWVQSICAKSTMTCTIDRSCNGTHQ